jgi:cardiolipin synthase
MVQVMGQRTEARKRGGRLGRLGRLLGHGFLGALVGCRSAGMPCTGDSSIRWPRGVIVAGQVMEDSAVALVNRPLRTAGSVAGEGLHHLGAAAQGSLTKRLLVPLCRPHGPVASCGPVDAEALAAATQALLACEAQPADIRLLIDGGNALAELEALIDQATCQIDILMFWWESDWLGERIAERLKARAAPNLRVRILIDGGGNLIFGESGQSAAEVNRVIADLARHPHIEVIRIRNPFARFDHRKIVIIDGRIVWSGGRNFNQVSFFHNHDLSFLVRGPLVLEMQELFEDTWRDQGGMAGSGQQAAGSEGETPQKSDNTATESYRPTAGCPLSSRAFLMHSRPGQRHLDNVLYQTVDRAQSSVYVENVSVQDDTLVYKLIRARQRGVDVRVVLTFSSTVELLNRANRVIVNRLLAAGIRVYLYPGMTHVKALMVDGCWAYVGTGNFDGLSFRHNTEIGLVITGGPVLEELERDLFQSDFNPAWEVREPVSVTPGDYFYELIAGMLL